MTHPHSNRGRWLVLLLAIAISVALRASEPSDAARLSAKKSVTYLNKVMDQYHSRFIVYEDVSSAGNHFHARAKLPDQNAPVEMDGSWTDRPHSGATSSRCVFQHQLGAPASFGGFYFQNGTLSGSEVRPALNFGTVPNAGIDLSGAMTLVFWARGAVGGEKVEFFVGGVGWNPMTGVPEQPYPDSSPRHPARGTIFTLTKSWQKFTIDVSGMDLSYMLAGLGWVADSGHNPQGAVFFLDDIAFELSAAKRQQRLNEPRFLRSFTTLPRQPDPFDDIRDGDMDLVLRNLAFTYDNALALLAYLGDGSKDSVRRARLIGDAFIYAMQHDRTYNDNRTCSTPVNPLTPNGARLRTAHAAGDVALPPGWNPKGRVGTAPVPGFYAEPDDTFYEVEYQAVDTGNNLWGVVALAALYQRTGVPEYLDAACKIANFVSASRLDTGTFRGFTGGVDNPESSPTRRMWASTEHQLDANAAFTTLYRLTGDLRWQQHADHAQRFIDAMWNSAQGCYMAGTTDPDTRNEDEHKLPLDVQIWSILSLPAALVRAGVLECAETRHLTNSDGFYGADFNDDLDGVWFEGTGQMAVAEARAGHDGLAETLRVSLRLAQQTKPWGDKAGIASASHEGVSTGFLASDGGPFKYFRRLHTAVAAWNVFGQMELNPYYSRTLDLSVSGRGSVVSTAGSCRSSCRSAWIDGTYVTLTAKPSSGWTVGSWSGPCAGSATQCRLRLTDEQDVTVTFIPTP
jgi:hypothetical protein